MSCRGTQPSAPSAAARRPSESGGGRTGRPDRLRVASSCHSEENSKLYPASFRADAVKLVRSHGRTVRAISRELGVSYESLRLWVKQAEIDGGERAGLTTDERDELRRLRRQVRALEEAREILDELAASVANDGTRTH